MNGRFSFKNDEGLIVNRAVFGLLVMVTTALMGLSFAVGKIDMRYISPLLLSGLRFLLAGSLLAFVVMRRPLPSSTGDWVRIALIGMIQTAGVMGCIFLSMRTISAGESAILTFVNPLLVIVLGTVFAGLKYRLIQWIGVIAGFFGVFVSLGATIQLHAGTWIGLTGALLWAVSTLLIKRWQHRFDVWVLTAYQMLFGGLILLFAAVALEHLEFEVNMISVAALLWLTVMGSVVQFALWFWLLQNGDAGKTSAFLFLAPFFGILSGWLILDETLRWFVIVGSGLIFIGIFLVNWPQSKPLIERRVTYDT